MLSLAVASLLSVAEPVVLASGVSPDGAYEVLLEADHDTPSFTKYAFKGVDENFPAFLVLERTSGAILGRFPWPGGSEETEALLRDRTEVKWRLDSAAVAINTRDMFYAHAIVLARDPESGRFANVALPSYAEISGRAPPPANLLRSRGRSLAVSWNPEGLLIFETWLWGEVDYPLSYRVLLRLREGRLVVQDREPILEDRPSW
jgi:hypothetical protein